MEGTLDKEAEAAFIFASGWHTACQWLPLSWLLT
jgi:hypothetical protein